MLIDAHAGEHAGDAHSVRAHGHFLLKASLAAFFLSLLLPVFGIGVYKNSSGQLNFEMWYPLGVMTIALVVMHEFIAPMPPKEVDDRP
jgi:hypothetical protein